MTKLIRLTDVKDRTGLSRSSIYAMISAGLFPAQVPVGLRAVCWVEEEVSNWIEGRIEASRPAAGRNSS